jgi:signal transduction histidine kinase
VLFRIFDTSGTIVYSSLTHQVGQQIPLDGDIEGALRGNVVAGLSEVEGDVDDMNLPASDLLEIYSPVRLRGTSDVLAVAEFYFTAEALHEDIAAAQRRSWLVVGAAMLATYLVLAYFVQRVSNTIAGQQRALADQVIRLRDLLAQNEELHDRVRGAAARTTALNERFLRRFSADLHDGPAQDISLALLRLDHVQAQLSEIDSGTGTGDDVAVIQESLRRALRDVRDTSSGLLLPELAEMTVSGTLDHALRSHRRRTGIGVDMTVGALPEDAPLAIKIALYRVVQEALANAFRHAPGSSVRIDAGQDDNAIVLAIADTGPGFDLRSAVTSDEHLGLVGMRERVESLGGVFRIASSPSGTVVSARLPVALTGGGND